MGDFTLIVVFGLLGAGIGYSIADDSWRRELVERGYAHYDTKTAEWQWSAP